ncbi:hypothetical protein H0486_03805 [Lachnospiraceae bacterium MD1]|jgi:Na+/melibiose symporter-like transporter|uniref:Uncharacterized protein n=1 Tax=Variimorphobacter saccharofermentans TaxID=2755051 RepID=A0A839JZB7_9FIRM|nr:hypothetical protein [Variimorphobacter saccharofermentans]MBB2181999.1 hypothetical protein [Variimorphobacter saccharofermentans]
MKNVKRIASIIGLILLVSMYIISLIAAIFASEKAPGFFLASVFCTIVIPIMIYSFIAVYQYVHRDDKKPAEEESSSNDNEEEQSN